MLTKILKENISFKSFIIIVEREKEMKNSNSTTILISFSVIIIVLGTVFILPILYNPQTNNSYHYPYEGYDRYINRYYNSSDQEKALNIAESFNYSKLLDISLSSGTNMDIYVNFISNSTIQFIDSYALNNINRTHVTLNYTAWVYDFNQVKILKSGSSISILSNGINYAIRNASSMADELRWFYTYNQTSNWYDKENNDFNYNYTDSGYIIDMKLSFDNVFGDLGATGTNIRQTLILDANFTILNICFGKSSYIS